MAYERTDLGTGITVLSERDPHLTSATVGVWVRTGSRSESPSDNGIGHFIEHMLFKGTERRRALDIAREIESVGGTINAFTDREYIFFFAKVLGRDFSLAVDLLADIFLHSVFDPAELSRERDVVLQEILMVEDNPEEALHDFFHESFYGGHPLGLPVQGTRETVSSFTRERVSGYFRERLRRRGVVVSVVGNLPHARIAEEFGGALGDLPPGIREAPSPPPPPPGGVFVKEKAIGQTHLCLGAPAVSRSSELRYAANLLNAILGGSMSSRLFQEVREKRGLAYSVGSSLCGYADGGILKICAGTTAERAEEFLAVTHGILGDLQSGGIREEEVSTARELLKGSILLSLENPEFRMTRIAMNEIYLGREQSAEEVLRRMDEVTVPQVRTLASSLLRPDRFSLAVLGEAAEASSFAP